jgi:hypothetical protein
MLMLSYRGSFRAALCGKTWPVLLVPLDLGELVRLG